MELPKILINFISQKTEISAINIIINNSFMNNSVNFFTITFSLKRLLLENLILIISFKTNKNTIDIRFIEIRFVKVRKLLC